LSIYKSDDDFCIFKAYLYTRNHMNRDDVKNLAELARLSISDEQADDYLKDFQSILGYIDTLNTVEVSEADDQHVLTNIVREDDDAYEAGEFTSDILDNAPHHEDGYLKVNKIL
jgi:aspartyl-tRNA(Asn)/glutamyl-tRNA(Gln) amidotransferase subunit C